MLKVAFLTQPKQDALGMRNIGDRLIFEGVRNLLRIAIGPYEGTERHLCDADPLPGDADIVVVCGMPQVSQGRAVGQHLGRIQQAAASTVPVKLNLGAGAFYFDAFGPDREKRDAAFADRVKTTTVAEAYREFARFDLCTCRDLAAAAALRGLGVNAIALPCPGFFSAIFQPRPLFRRQAQLVSVLNGTASFWNRVDADVHGFYRRLWESDPTRVFLAHDEQDCEMLSDMGIPHVVFATVEEFLGYLAMHERLLSVRVHGALPAWTLGLDVTLLGIDRRALIGDDFGARFRVVPVREEKDLATVESAERETSEHQDDDVRREWLWQYAEEYVRRIREVVSRKLGCEFSDEFAIEPEAPGTVGCLGETPGPPRRDGLKPMISRPRGRYFSRLFYRDENEFTIEPKLFRSAHSIACLDDGVSIEVTSLNQILLYGPYVRIPKGRWKVTTSVRVEGEAFEVSAEHRVVLRIVKGIPARELSRVEHEISPATTGALFYEGEFENGYDAGLLETVFTCQPTLPIATCVVFGRFEMKRLGEPGRP